MGIYDTIYLYYDASQLIHLGETIVFALPEPFYGSSYWQALHATPKILIKQPVFELEISLFTKR